MVDMGDIPFRTGGTSGVAHMLFGNWAELGEGVLHLDASACQRCGRVQLFADSRTRFPGRLSQASAAFVATVAAMLFLRVATFLATEADWL
jgi:hypothetical protein